MEKREFVRLNVELEVAYRVIGSMRDLAGTRTEDASEGGIRVMFPEKVQPDTRLEISIKIPGEEKPVFAVGKVVWVRPDIFGGVYMTGIQFVHIKQADRQRLYKYVVL